MRPNFIQMRLEMTKPQAFLYQNDEQSPEKNKISSDKRSVPKNNKKAELSQDDRAMRRMYGCPENFRESLTTPTATFPEIFNGLLFRLSL